MSKVIDLTGQKFGYWEVLERAENSKGGQARWLCRCVCGKEKVVVGSTLRNGKSTNCGCIKAQKSREGNGKFVNEIGKRYGRLTVIAKDEELSITKHRAHWVCKCDCGNIKVVSSKCLRDGKTKSCGCLVSHGEELITKILATRQVEFGSQYSIIINNKNYRFDFVLYRDREPLALIEFHGIQHYDEDHEHWGKNVTINQERDKIKATWAEEKGIPLHIIPYWEKENLEEVVDDILNRYNLLKEAQEVVE